jgi:hypothetical protein
MAGIVRGELDGSPIMLENAATEATLEALLQATLANSSNKSQAAKIQKAYEDSLKRTTKDQEKNLDVLKRQKKAIEDEKSERESLNRTIREEKARREKLFQGLHEFGELVGKGINVAFSSATPKVSDFTNALSGIPIIGPIIGAMGNAMQGQIDKFRELSQVGADFGGGIDQVRVEAARAGMSLDTFTSAITSNSSNLALLGGNAANGAKIFSQVNKSLQGPFQQSLARLGFSMEETAEYTAGYLVQQTRLGLAQRMTQTQLNKGAQDYLIELDKLARVHGMSRKEAQAALDAQTQDKRFQLFYAQMGAMGKETSSFMAGLQHTDKEFADGMADLIMNNGIPSANNEMANSIALQSPALVSMAKQLREGTITQEQANKIIRQESKLAQQRASVDGKNMALFTNLGNSVYTSTASLLKFQTHGEKSVEAIDAQAAAMESAAKNQANLDKSLLNLRNMLMTALMPTFRIFTDMITKNIGNLEKFATALAEGLETFMKTVGDKGLGTAIGQVLGDVIKSAFSALFSSPGAVGGLVGAIGLLFGAAAVKAVVITKLAELLSSGGGKGALARGGLMASPAGLGLMAVGGIAYAAKKTSDDKKEYEQFQKRESMGERLTQEESVRYNELSTMFAADIHDPYGNSNTSAKPVKPTTPNQSSAETARLNNVGKVATPTAQTNTVAPDMIAAAEVATVRTAEEVTAIAKALQTLDYARLTVPEATIKSIDDGTLKLRSLRGEVNAMSTSFKTLNNTGLEKITAGINRLDESFKNFNKSFAQDFMEKFKELDKKTQEALLTDLNNKMDQLNTSTNALVELASENTKNGKNIARNTQGANGKVF